jgi:hypothetical protein
MAGFGAEALRTFPHKGFDDIFDLSLQARDD